MYLCACGRCSSRQAPRVGQWVYRAAAPIEECSHVVAAADKGVDLVAFEYGDVGALGGPFLCAVTHLGETLRTGSTLDPPDLGGIAVNAMTPDDVEHEIGRTADRLC